MPKNMNLQTWYDVRKFATIASWLERQRVQAKSKSELLSYILDDLFEHVTGEGFKPFSSTLEAHDWLVGNRLISGKQGLEKRRIFQTIGKEELEQTELEMSQLEQSEWLAKQQANKPTLPSFDKLNIVESEDSR